MSDTKFYMQKCLELAKQSGADVPVGAIVVKDGKIVSYSYNKKEAKGQVTAHAEILALNEAAKKMNNWRLTDCNIYVTLEPCPMCAWAILNSNIKNVYFGASDIKYGAFGGALNLLNYSNFKTKVFGGIMEEECEELLKEYFRSIRK